MFLYMLSYGVSKKKNKTDSIEMQTIEHGRGKRRRIMNDLGTLLPAKFTSYIHIVLSADIITDILSRLPGDSVVRCRHVCKTWRALIDGSSRKIWTTFLPADITINILSRVSADSIIQCCKCVCKTWRALIDHPSFAETHTRRLSSSSSSSSDHHMGTKSSAGFFLYEYTSKICEFHFVEFIDNMCLSKQPITNHPCSFRFRNLGPPYTSSSNGLVFTGSVLSNHVNSTFFICNPFTREYIHLSSSSPKEEGFMVYGFGYHPCTNEYKVVSIHYSKRAGITPEYGWVSVYTLGSGRWRNIGEIQYPLVRNRRPGSLANGVLHWMIKDDKKIVSFDLADEKFRIVPSPPSMLSPNDIVDELGVLEGCLCVTRNDKTTYQSPREIWVLNHHNIDNVNTIVNPEEYSRLWTKMEFSIPWNWSNSFVAEPHVILKGGKVLLRDKDGLVSYNPNTKHFNKYNEDFNHRMWFDIIPYTKSFVSLKALGEKYAKSFG